jgi:hypothetical protein
MNATVRAKVIGVDIPFQHETTNLTILRKEERRIRRKQQNCYILSHPLYVHDDGTPVVLYSVCRNCRIDEEGPPGVFFHEAPNEVQAVAGVEEEGEPLPAEVATILPWR